MAKQKRSNAKAHDEDGRQFEFQFSDPGYSSIAKIAIEHPIALRRIDDSSVLLDWLGMGSTEFVRAVIQAIEQIAVCQFPHAPERVKPFPGVFRDGQGRGHLSVELGLASNGSDDLPILIDIHAASVSFIHMLFTDVTPISEGAHDNEPVITDVILRAAVEMQVAAMRRKFKDKLVPTPIIVTIGEHTWLCKGRITSLLKTTSPTKEPEVIAGRLTQIAVAGERFITLRTKDRGTVVVNCRSRSEIREVRQYVDEAVHIRLEVETTYEGDVPTAYSYLKFIDALPPHLL